MRRSFTLVETLIAVFIIVTALIGFISLAFYSYSLGGQSTERMMATGLAREGMEAARAIRDSNWLSLRNWDDGGLDASGTYIANTDSSILTNTDLLNTDIQNCGDCGLCLISGQYVHCGGSPNTIYRRMFTVTNISENEKRISSEVLWQTKGVNRKIKLEQILTDWR